MKEMALWISGAALAFLVTASAFLLLASLATVPSEKSLAPEPPSSRSGLELDLHEERLASLRAVPDQVLEVEVENEGTEDLSDVHLILGVSSENTALPDFRYYRRAVEKLPAGESATIRIPFDLSSSERTPPAPSVAPEPSRKVLEVRASTPEGVTEIRTAILPP
ncbi:MAG: hypothetical protein ACRDTR_11770 [Rubrobacter sp.]